MTANERSNYFGLYWPKACAAKGWVPNDGERRRAVVLECMRQVRGPLVTTSDPAFGRDETTALFCYLDHLAHPGDLDRSARWLDCCKDYRAFNRARQADWYEEKAYGAKGSKKLRKDRFAGAQSAQGEPLEEFNPRAINARFITMASRAQKKARIARKNAAGVDLATHAPALAAAVETPDPAYVPPTNQPF